MEWMSLRGPSNLHSFTDDNRIRPWSTEGGLQGHLTLESMGSVTAWSMVNSLGWRKCNFAFNKPITYSFPNVPGIKPGHQKSASPSNSILQSTSPFRSDTFPFPLNLQSPGLSESTHFHSFHSQSSDVLEMRQLYFLVLIFRNTDRRKINIWFGFPPCLG